MGSFANAIFSGLLGWVQSVARSFWNAFSADPEHSAFAWIGKNWMLLAAVLTIVGLVCDLGVYLLRWQPFRVWRDFWRHRRTRGEEIDPEEGNAREESDAFGADSPEEAPNESALEEEPIPDTAPYEEPAPDAAPAAAASVSGRRLRRRQEDGSDFSRWEEPAAVSAQETEAPRTYRTPAGYVVPEDSPYRRPAAATQDNYSTTGEIEQRIVRSGRRRRAVRLVRELSENATGEYPAVEDLINAEEAYFRPVYPQNWQEREKEYDE